jgi:hypothetical protein
MYKRLDPAHRPMSLILGVLTLVSLGVLLAWNVNPTFFPIRAHGFLAAFPLAMIAIAYLLYQSARRPSAKEFLKAMMLAVVFLFWAANQLWPELPQATFFNDTVIALFPGSIINPAGRRTGTSGDPLRDLDCSARIHVFGDAVARKL